MTLRTTDDTLGRQLERALETAEADRVRYHLREALQLHIIDSELADEQSKSSEPPNQSV